MNQVLLCTLPCEEPDCQVEKRRTTNKLHCLLHVSFLLLLRTSSQTHCHSSLSFLSNCTHAINVETLLNFFSVGEEGPVTLGATPRPGIRCQTHVWRGFPRPCLEQRSSHTWTLRNSALTQTRVLVVSEHRQIRSLSN